MLLSMICWGSWANTIKLTPGWPIQLFYWDYVIGILLGSLAWGVILGGGPGVLFPAIAAADPRHLLLALAGGIIFNAANLLLVVAIEIAGLAVAFPLGIGLALLIGVLLNYAFSPAGNVWLLFIGVALVAVAIVIDAIAYRRREQNRTKITGRGILLSLIAGVLMGLFYPLVARSMHGPGSLGPYSVVPVFAVGIALCSVPTVLWLMRHPLPEQKPLSMSQYFSGRPAWHLWGLIGGAIWCSGAVCRPGDFLRDRPRRNDGFGRLGSLRVARVSRSPRGCAAAYPADVSLLFVGTGCNCVSAELLGGWFLRAQTVEIGERMGLSVRVMSRVDPLQVRLSFRDYLSALRADRVHPGLTSWATLSRPFGTVRPRIRTPLVSR
jgi:glucose uptake protein